MNAHLLVYVKVTREKFHMERFLGSDNILALVRSGSFEFESENGKYTVEKDQAALFRADTLYHRRIITPATIYLFRYRADMPLFNGELITFSDRSRLRSTMDMLDRIDTGVFKDEAQYSQHLFMDIATQYALENNVYVNNENCDDIIQAAVAYIKKNFHKRMSLSDPALSSGLSYVQFSRRFKVYTGMSPSEYVTSLRLQKARELLSGTSIQIKRISELCGFENEYYFSNFFKKHTGLSPSSFRSASK